MGYLKHDANGSNGKRSRKKNQPKPVPVLDPDEARYGHEGLAKEAAFQANDYRMGVNSSRCVEEALDGLTSVISRYVTQARDGENGSSLYTEPRGYPVKVQLTAGTDEEDCTVWIECEALDRMATAFERIADAITKEPSALSPDNP